MYEQPNFDVVKSLMKEVRERGSPAYLFTVRGSVCISQLDFLISHQHVTTFFLKVTFHPSRAMNLNISYRLILGHLEAHQVLTSLSQGST
jgi:platelet-activating factor acetylhydrolase